MRSNGASLGSPSRLMIVGALVLVFAGLYLARPVLIPITLSVLFAFLLDPIVDRLQRWGVGRVASVAIVGGMSLLALLVLAALFSLQVANLVDDMPGYSRNIQQKFEVVWDPVREFLGRAQKSVEQVSASNPPDGIPPAEAIQVVEVSKNKEMIASWLVTLSAPLGTLAIVIVLAGAMMIQASELRDRIVRLVGYGQVSITTQALDDVADRVSKYLLAQTLLNASQGTAIAIGLLAIGVPNAVFFAISWTILRFLPYIGPWLGAILPILTSLGYFEGMSGPILTIALFVVVELIGNMVLEPWFYGRRTGLSPIAVIVSAIFWTWLWGWVGLLLATPMTVCLAVLGKYVEPLEFLHVLLGDEPVLRPSTRLYQRLLSGKRAEAREIVQEELRGKRTMVEVLQNTFVRALASVDEDCQKGWIEDQKATEVYEEAAKLLDELGGTWPAQEHVVVSGSCLCIPVRDEADVLCGRLFEVLCRQRGITVEIVPSGYLASEKGELVATQSPDVVLLSVLSSTRLPFLRHTLRNIMGRSNVPVVVGIWHGEYDLARSGDDLGAVVVGSFSEALDAIRLAIKPKTESLTRTLRVSSPPVATKTDPLKKIVANR